MVYLKSKKLGYLGVASVLLLAVVAPVAVSRGASAAALAQSFVRFDRMKISEATTGTVCANPATVATENSVDVTFPTGYTLGAFGTFAVGTTNVAWPAGAVAWPTITAPSGGGQITGQTVNFTGGDLTPGTLYCFNWTNSAAVAVKSSATNNNVGTVTTRSAGGPVDSGNYATASVTDDQILVTASIDRTFSFALSANADALGTLSSGAVTPSPTPVTATVNTNAVNGWYVWAKDANTGLSSATAVHTIASTTPGTNSTLGAGTEGFNTGVTQSQVGGTGTITVAAPFVGGLLGKGGGLDTGFRTLASSTGTANTAVLTLTNNAAVSSVTAPASDYTDTITVVGAGLF